MSKHDYNSPDLFTSHHPEFENRPLGTQLCSSNSVTITGPSKDNSYDVKLTTIDGVEHDNRLLGPGGAPTRATTLPTDPLERKNFPIATGVLDYFPDAIVAISEISKAGNDQHNPGLPLRWTRSKSGDEADTCMRHFLQRGTLDTDGKRHTAKAAWRLLAFLQKEIESEQSKK